MLVGILIGPRMWNCTCLSRVNPALLWIRTRNGSKRTPVNWRRSYWQSAALPRRSATSSWTLSSSAAVRTLLCLCLLFMLTRTQKPLRYQPLLDSVFCLELVLVRGTYCYSIHCTAKHHVYASRPVNLSVWPRPLHSLSPCLLRRAVVYNKINNIRQHNTYLLQYIGYMFRPVNRSSSGHQ